MEQSIEEATTLQFRVLIDLQVKDQLPNEVKEGLANMFASLYKDVNSSFVRGLQQLLINMSSFILACKNSAGGSCYSEGSKNGGISVVEGLDKEAVVDVPAAGTGTTTLLSHGRDYQNVDHTIVNASSVSNASGQITGMGNNPGDCSNMVPRHGDDVGEQPTDPHSSAQARAHYGTLVAS